MAISPLDQTTEYQLEQRLKPRRPQLSRKWWLLAPLVLLPVFLGVRELALRSAPDPTPEVQPLPVETMVLQAVDSYAVERTYTGEITARRRSDLGFERAGTVVAILVDDGDRVTAGTPIARLDTRDLGAQRQQLEAQKWQAMAQLEEFETGPRPEVIAAAQAAVADLRHQLELARLQQQRRTSLYQDGAISREELDAKKFSAAALESRLQQAQSQLDELLAGTRQEQISGQKAQVAQLEARIRAVDIALAKSVIKAPFSGTVSARTVDEGVVVAAGKSVLRLVEGGPLEARIGVPTSVAETLKTGSRQQLEVKGRRYRAKVTGQLPELDANSRTVTVVLNIAEPQGLTVSSTARLVVTETKPAQGVWLPTTAMVAGERGLWSAYVVTPTESGRYRVSRRDIEVLHTEGDRVLVRGLVEPGDRIISRGTHRIVPDQWVKLTD